MKLKILGVCFYIFTIDSNKFEENIISNEALGITQELTHLQKILLDILQNLSDTMALVSSKGEAKASHPSFARTLLYQSVKCTLLFKPIELFAKLYHFTYYN